MALNSTDGMYPLLVDLPTTARQQRLTVAVMAIVLVAFAVLAPFSGIPLVELNAFFPSLDAIVFVTDLITAVLLFSQFSVSRSLSLFALAIGYLFTAMIVVPHALTFAGAFTPAGLLGAGIQTGSWLFLFWHFGFAAALLAYTALRKQRVANSASDTPAGPAIGRAVASVFALVCGLTWLATAGATLLPPIILDNARISPSVIYPVWLIVVVTAIALVLLALYTRSVLDQWLIVVALVSILELVFSGLLPSVRFSVGFYAGRVLSLITSSVVLIVLISETTALYARSARVAAVEHRERERRINEMEAVLIHLSRVNELGQNVSALIHEVSQPLAAISNYAAASIHMLERSEPDRAKALLERLAEQTVRATDIIHHLRDFITRQESQKEVENLVLVLRDAAGLALAGTTDQAPTIEMRCDPAATVAFFDRVQIEQVVFNLVRNAAEAMAGGVRRVLTLTTELSTERMVEVRISDTGPGLSSEVRAKLFEPFVTTKAGGLGIGLSICRLIIEAHGGQLKADDNPEGGTTFRFTLPQAPTPVPIN